MLNRLFLILATLITLSYQQKPSASCFSCARSDQYFCDTGSSNPWEVKCCQTSFQENGCSSPGNSKCSSIFFKGRSKFYSSCPQQTKSNCGLLNNYDDLVLYANDTKQTFTFNGLRWKTQEYKIPTYQACSYTVKNPPGGFNGGKVYIKFTQLERGGVTLYVSSDGGVGETTISSSSSRIYSIENGK